MICLLGGSGDRGRAPAGSATRILQDCPHQPRRLLPWLRPSVDRVLALDLPGLPSTAGARVARQPWSARDLRCLTGDAAGVAEAGGVRRGHIVAGVSRTSTIGRSTVSSCRRSQATPASRSGWVRGKQRVGDQVSSWTPLELMVVEMLWRERPRSDLAPVWACRDTRGPRWRWRTWPECSMGRLGKSDASYSLVTTMASYWESTGVRIAPSSRSSDMIQVGRKLPVIGSRVGNDEGQRSRRRR